MTVLGIDLGYTVVTKEKTPFDDAFRVIRRFKQAWKNVIIVSRVNEEQKRQSLAWLDKHNFYGVTGIPDYHVFYCAERHEKAIICQQQGVTHFIDDRPEVMSHLAPHIHKLLFNPIQTDVDKFQDKLILTKIVGNWKEIESLWLPETT